MRLKYGVAIAGTPRQDHHHLDGRHLLDRAVSIPPWSSAALKPAAPMPGWASGDFMVVEADESDGSFLKLTPTIAIVTNIDREHLDHYKTFDDVQDASSTSSTRCRSTASR